MDRKTQIAYEDVFQFITEKVYSLHLSQSFTSDYERAMRNALKKLYPTAQFYACCFHYTQAVKRRITQLPGLMELMHEDELARSIYKRAQCLALLPADYIPDTVDAFKGLVTEAAKLDADKKATFRPFLVYMKAMDKKSLMRWVIHFDRRKVYNE